MRIELGGGGNPRYHPNIDAVPGPGVDIVHDLTKGIPLSDDSVDAIYSTDFYEHLTFSEGLALLKECKRCLVSTGFIEFVIPDMPQGVKANSQWNQHLSNIVYGTRRNQFDVHKSWYTPEFVKYILENEGWGNVGIIPVGAETPEPKFMARAWKLTSKRKGVDVRDIPQEYWDNCRKYLNDSYTLPVDEIYPNRYLAITTQLNELKPKPHTILEIGCFIGYGMNILEDNGFEVYGIDIFKGGLEARVNDNIVKASVESLPFADKSFDAVISLGVLEHIHRSGVKETLKEMERVGRVNVHRIHMKGFGSFWEGRGWHVTVEPIKFWQDLLEKLGVKGEWYLYHEP